MEVLIVAKTKWGDLFCIGAVEISTRRFLRLMDINGGYQPSNNPFRIGQIWDINYNPIPGKAPHKEDVKVTSKNYVKDVSNLATFIKENFSAWEGDPSKLFDSKLKWKNKSGYLNDPDNLPENSVGFWISDKDLYFDDGYYNYKRNKLLLSIFDKRLKYKGETTPIEIIPAGTLIRVSLAKWWNMDGNSESRCYLQLSGWY